MAGYQEGGEPRWWWEVARHLNEAQIALINAMAHNLDDQTEVFALQDKLNDGQRILLEIFREKGLLKGQVGGAAAPPPAAAPQPAAADVPLDMGLPSAV
jgi:hypothetical protein